MSQEVKTHVIGVASIDPKAEKVAFEESKAFVKAGAVLKEEVLGMELPLEPISEEKLKETEEPILALKKDDDDSLLLAVEIGEVQDKFEELPVPNTVMGKKDLCLSCKHFRDSCSGKDLTKEKILEGVEIINTEQDVTIVTDCENYEPA